MKPIKLEILLGIILIVLSAIFYIIHYVVFRDPHHIFIYLIGDIAFVFIEVLLVTLILHQLLTDREKRTRIEKLNMVIETFFSEVGTELLVFFSDFDPNLELIRNELIVTNDWSEQEFLRVRKSLRNYDYNVMNEKIRYKDLRSFLMKKRDFLLRILENPTLYEQESFTKLLRAVFHLTEELEIRKNIKDSPKTDREHLAGDIKRAYTLIVHQWLDYMKYLKDNYPYLFSLAMRTNPFDQNASPIVK